MVSNDKAERDLLKVGLVGCGRISRAHVSALSQVPGVEVRAVCDTDRDRALEIANVAGHAAVYEDLAAMIEQEKLDAVHVLTPPPTHAALAIRAMEAGCHVFVEKPMALSVCEADEVIAAARRTGRKLGVGHNYLFKPSVRKALELVRNGSIGDVAFIHTYYGLAAETGAYATAAGRAQSAWRWKLRGGVFADFLPHLVYLQLALVDGIERIAGVSVLPSSPADAEPTEMGIQYEGHGVLGQMTISMRAKPYAKYIEVYGTKGIVRADLARELCTLHRERRMPGALSKMLYSLEESAQLALGTAGTAAQVAAGRMKRMPEMPVMLREFYASIRNDTPLPVPVEQGRQVAIVTEEILARLPEPRRITEPAASTRAPGPRPATRAEEEFAQTASSRTVFVTGGTGFLGQRLIEALHRTGARVVALVRDDTRVPVTLAGKADFVRGDVRDFDAVAAALQDASIVFHTAAVTTNAAPWQVHYETNVVGTENVLRAAAQAGVAHAVHVSSVAVYGLADRRTAIDEAEPFPETIDRWAYYMRTKIEAEKVATRIATEHGLGLSILRLGLLYGPGAARPVGRGLLQLGSLRFTVGAGRNRLPYTYVDNAVDCMLLAALRALPGVEAYNVVDPPVSVREAAIADGRVRNENVKVVPVPSVLLSAAALLAELKSRNGSAAPKLSRYAVRSATRDVVYATDKVRSRLGWEPVVSLAEGLRRTQSWRT